MWKNLIFLALLVTVYGQSLPDLGVNRDQITCDNYKSLTPVANSDKTRLEGIVSDLNDNIPVIVDVTGLAKEACEKGKNIKALPTAFLQQRKSKALSAMNSVLRQLKQLSEVALSNEQNPFDQMINDHIDQAFNQIQSLEGMNSAESIAAVCADLNQALNDLVSYLQWAVKEIQSNLIDDFLAKRIETLNGMSSKCQKKILKHQRVGVDLTEMEPVSKIKDPSDSTLNVWEYEVEFPNTMNTNTPDIGFYWSALECTGTISYKLEAKNIHKDGVTIVFKWYDMVGTIKSNKFASFVTNRQATGFQMVQRQAQREGAPNHFSPNYYSGPGSLADGSAVVNIYRSYIIQSQGSTTTIETQCSPSYNGSQNPTVPIVTNICKAHYIGLLYAYTINGFNVWADQ